MIIVGVPGLVDSFARFALEGLGAPAPIAPTQKLLVTGLYRYVRNPSTSRSSQSFLVRPFCLVTGVSSGTALLWLFFHVWVVMIEEQTLKQTFGTEYEDFQANVPRWIPRFTPWRDVRRG